MTIRTLLQCCVLLCAVLLCAACANDEDHDRERLQNMKREILSIVGIPTCSGEQSCRVVGLGVKPCGGPWEYLIYSVENVDEPVLLRKVREYNEFEEELNAKYGYVSDCALVGPPPTGCRNGRCVDLRTAE